MSSAGCGGVRDGSVGMCVAWERELRYNDSGCNLTLHSRFACGGQLCDGMGLMLGGSGKRGLEIHKRNALPEEQRSERRQRASPCATEASRMSGKHLAREPAPLRRPPRYQAQPPPPAPRLHTHPRPRQRSHYHPCAEARKSETGATPFTTTYTEPRYCPSRFTSDTLSQSCAAGERDVEVKLLTQLTRLGLGTADAAASASAPPRGAGAQRRPSTLPREPTLLANAHLHHTGDARHTPRHHSPFNSDGNSEPIHATLGPIRI